MRYLDDGDPIRDALASRVNLEAAAAKAEVLMASGSRDMVH